MSATHSSCVVCAFSWLLTSGFRISHVDFRIIRMTTNSVTLSCRGSLEQRPVALDIVDEVSAPGVPVPAVLPPAPNINIPGVAIQPAVEFTNPLVTATTRPALNASEVATPVQEPSAGSAVTLRDVLVQIDKLVQPY
jgi:hypothetical protein